MNGDFACFGVLSACSPFILSSTFESVPSSPERLHVVLPTFSQMLGMNTQAIGFVFGECRTLVGHAYLSYNAVFVAIGLDQRFGKLNDLS